MLEVRNISFAYEKKSVVNSIDFTIKQGQNISIIGESGCGKSTLLKLIYGLYDLDKGQISWKGVPILGPKFNLVPSPDFMKYLAQDFDLMPYITVEENVGKFLSNIHLDKKKQRVGELLEMLEMTEFAQTKIKYLSGGQQQRVALARVLANEPKVLLLDEPFSQIDSFRKNALRRNLFAYLKQKEITCIIATHDSVDALSYADYAIAMRHGAIIHQDNPAQIYQNPINKYVASLFGEVNEIPVNVLIPSADSNRKIILYAHELYLTETSDFEVVVKNSYFRGNQYLIKAAYEKKVIFFDSPLPIPKNEIVFLTVNKNLILSRLQ